MSDEPQTLQLTREQRAFAEELIAGIMDDVDAIVAKAVEPLKAEIEALRAELDGARND